MRQSVSAPHKAGSLWSWLWWPFVIAFAAGICWMTLVLMQPPSPRTVQPDGARGSRHVMGATPAVIGDADTTNLPSNPVSRTDGALDVLAQLANQHQSLPGVRSSNQSPTLHDALQRAFQYPTFDQVAKRTDPEGLFEAAAWALACRGSIGGAAGTGGTADIPAGRASRTPDTADGSRLRCSDARLASPGFGDRKLLEAVAAGQPGAALTWAQLHPTQWMDTALPDGTPFSDRLLAMAAHGDVTALLLWRQYCARPGACTEPVLTRNVLAVLAIERAKGMWPPEGEQSLEGTPKERREAVARADALRPTLPSWR